MANQPLSAYLPYVGTQTLDQFFVIHVVSLIYRNVATAFFSVALNRPEKMNAMNNLLWEEIGAVFDRLATDPDCRAIVLRQGNVQLLTCNPCRSGYPVHGT